MRTLFLIGFPALLSAALLTSCEDDPILAPQTGSKQTNGSYGNIAVAPPVDSTALRSGDVAPAIGTNPEVY